MALPVILIAAVFGAFPALAQQVTGELGSPGATTTISGKQLPPPDPKFGGVIAEQATGFPGYDSVIGVDNATIGRILRDNGYATSWFGKDHNTPTYEASQAGPFTQWPTGMGFDYFYGFVGGDAKPTTPLTGCIGSTRPTPGSQSFSITCPAARTRRITRRRNG
jgi:hypothetical protein